MAYFAVSVDTPEENTKFAQHVEADYPILADSDKKVSDLYGMIHPNSLNNLTVRSVFIIDPNKKLRLRLGATCPTMMEDKMGNMGKTQGVNDKSKPKTRNAAPIFNRFPPCSTL